MATQIIFSEMLSTAESLYCKQCCGSGTFRLQKKNGSGAKHRPKASTSEIILNSNFLREDFESVIFGFALILSVFSHPIDMNITGERLAFVSTMYCFVYGIDIPVYKQVIYIYRISCLTSYQQCVLSLPDM